jgi:predicted nucleotidyltransferase component of viral defense system
MSERSERITRNGRSAHGATNRLWGGVYELAEMLEGMPGGMAFAVRDFALVTLAGELSATFPGQLVFKGGFVLRHAHGHLRFSKDVDATRHAPPTNKLEAGEVAAAIRDASIQNVVQFVPGEPATDSIRSLDFDKVHVTGEVFPDSQVQVEVSYREAVVGTPIPAHIGHPFYEPFEILTMEPAEMVAEKLRALAQRLRETDLADLAVLLHDDTISDDAVARFAETKFELVKQGRANRIDRIERNFGELAETYDDVVPQLFPGAPSYREAADIVWPRIKSLVP